MNKFRFPMMFQGNVKKKNYFEGWYYKFVSKDQSSSIAFIPGISLNKKDEHAFIQVFLSNHQTSSLDTWYVRYPLEEFSYDYFKNIVSIGDSKFGLLDVYIDMKDDVNIKGHFELEDITDIKRTFLSPSIMGFFRYIPFMECYHGVVSMNHLVDGNVLIEQDTYCFDQGKGYIEKDWGTSFPKWYTWIQCNHFKKKSTSFMLSYAKIPFLGFGFKGFLVNLIVKGKEYRFGTYNFSKIKVTHYDDKQISFEIKKRDLLLKVVAKNKGVIELPAPSNGVMKDLIKEGLSGIVELVLIKKGNVIYQDTGTMAGLEIMLENK